jgi:hypothetical protein
MPAHMSRLTATTAGKSDGSPLSYVDWRANRLVDALAKAAARTRRLPAELRSLHASAAQAAGHAAALLGVVTHAANNFQESHWDQEGRLHTRTYRDAWLPPFQDHASGARSGQRGSRGAVAKAREQPAELAPCAATPSVADSARAAKAKAREQQELREEAREGRALQTWLSDCAATLRPAAGPTATERLEAVRRRIAAKEAAA